MDGKTSVKQIIVFLLVLSSVQHFSFAVINPVQTSTGLITGTVFPYQTESVQAYLGIPYAEPPVGNLRFRKTVPKIPCPELLQATAFPPACLQSHGPNSPQIDAMPNQSEDCLYLNVWVPPNTTELSKKAVMFWIHGGRFRFGSNRLPAYYGHVLAAVGDVIVVTVNHRLSILGFISAMTDEAPGNMGLHDMLEALKWVNRNIGAFGGDSDNITFFGHSSGAISCGLMCVSHLAKGLFKRAILESQSPALPMQAHTKFNADFAQKVAKAVGCASDENSFSANPDGVIRCLRTKDAKQLVELTIEVEGENPMAFFPVVGDEFFPIEPKVQLITGIFNDVDVMIGYTQDEGTIGLLSSDMKTFGYFGEKSPQLSKTEGAEYIRNVFYGFPGKELIVQYYLRGLEEDDYDAVREQTYHSIGDFFISCPATYFAECYAKRGINVYAYYFNHISSVISHAQWMGSAHFEEVPFVFGRPLDHVSNYTPNEQSLSRQLIRIWTNFAKTGYPDENWQPFSRINPYIKEFNISNRTSYLKQLRKNCEFFRSFIGYL